MSTNDPTRRRRKTKRPALTAREVRFCQLLITDDLSRYEAYLRAGFPPKDTRHATEQAAWRLVKNREVLDYLEHLRGVAARAARITVQELAVLIAEAASADIRRLYDRKGNVLPPDQWPDDVASAVEGLESEERLEPVPGVRGRKQLAGYGRKIKLTNKTAARRLAAEWLGMIGHDKADGQKAPDPLVVGGDADLGQI